MSRRTFTYAVHICLSTDKTCALKVKRINYPASGTSRKGKKPITGYVQYGTGSLVLTRKVDYTSILDYTRL